MKRVACAGLSLALLVLIMVAQAVANSTPAAPPPGNKVVLISGQVSLDGATLVNDGINKWRVTNTASMKGYEGAYVSVTARIDADNHTIQVLSVSRQRLAKANRGDSAFRR
jgi:hypothetical protein